MFVQNNKFIHQQFRQHYILVQSLPIHGVSYYIVITKDEIKY